MASRLVSITLAGLMATALFTTGCTQAADERAEKAAMRAEDAARRAESAAGRVEAAARRAEEAAEKVDSRGYRK
jgi:outer membrane lipoprotein-sorting protein